MLLHLPIAILTTLSPIPVSETVPKFDIAKACRLENESSKAFDRCSRDEADALQQLQTEWQQFADADRNTCFSEATIGGFVSYVELLTCLEMTRGVRNEKAAPRNQAAKTGSRTIGPADPEMSVVDRQK